MLLAFCYLLDSKPLDLVYKAFPASQRALPLPLLLPAGPHRGYQSFCPFIILIVVAGTNLLRVLDTHTCVRNPPFSSRTQCISI